jgi:hypothetical protein
MQFQTIDFDFPAQAGTQYRHSAIRQGFSRKVLSAGVALIGYTFNLADDREVKSIVVRLDHEIQNINPENVPEVRVVANFGIQDGSGYYNDTFTGSVRALLMYELEPLEGRPFDDGRVGEFVREVFGDNPL